MGDLRSYLLVAVMAAGLTYCLTPLVRAVVLRIGAVDQPGGRKMHAIATPTLGGLALFFGFIGGLGLSSLLFPRLFVSSEAAGIAIGAALMVGIGIVEQLGDDVGVFFDAGPAKEGPASTILDLSGPRPRLLREGAIPAGELERLLEEPLADGP